MSAHNLLLVNEPFARDQYARARRHLGATFLGFAWACESPRHASGCPDVDSGPIVPFVDASASSSGLAIFGASAFRGAAYLDGLLASAELAGFRPGSHYRASNDVGDSVLLYALTFPPLWNRVRTGAPAGTATLGAAR